jgi:hypothetical protein
MVNRDGFDLGRLQNGQRVDNVLLPPWARSYHHFVRMHRAALESEHVSRNLHHWIDLIFGYKQRGKAAEEALNVFYYTSYEGAVDPDSATTEAERAAQEGMIREFGQTPSQLLTTPHPQRMTREQALRVNRGGGGDGAVVLSSLFERLSQLRTFVIARAAPAPLTLIAPRYGNNLRAWLMRGLAQRMVTVSSVGHIGNHDWQPVPVKSRTLKHQDSEASLGSPASLAGMNSPEVLAETAAAASLSEEGSTRLARSGSKKDAAPAVKRGDVAMLDFVLDSDMKNEAKQIGEVRGALATGHVITHKTACVTRCSGYMVLGGTWDNTVKVCVGGGMLAVFQTACPPTCDIFTW